MTDSPPLGAVLAFGRFRLDRSQRLLWAGDQVQPLEPKVFETLLALVEARGRLVSKEELLARVWPDTFVEEGSLTRNVSTLRKVLGEGADTPRFIETIPKRGYRFIAEVGTPDASDAATVAPLETGPAPLLPAPPRGGSRARAWAWAAIVLVVAAGASIWSVASSRARATTAAGTVRSIAVLPLRNLSDESQEFFSDGITEELITTLAQIQSLKVISRTSIMRYKHSDEPLQQIARELGVDAVIEGSIQRNGDRVRVTAQLIDARTDTHLWARTYDERLADVLSVQSNVAREIADQVRVRLSPGETKVQSVDPSAYEQVLLGRFFHNRMTRSDVLKAIELLEGAVAKDSRYAPAYAALAAAYNSLGSVFVAGEPPASARLSAIRAAVHAIELDPNSADAYAALGQTSLRELDWVQASSALHKAIELCPSCVQAHLSYSSYLVSRGQLAEAINEARRAVALDPASVSARHNLAWMLYFNREYPSAIQHLRTALDMDPSYVMARWRLGQVHIANGQFGEAAHELERAASEGVRAPAILGLLAIAYGRQGLPVKVRRIIEELEKRSATDTVPPGALFTAYLGTGDMNKAVDALEKVFETRDNYAIYIGVDPLLDPLRGNARFEKLRLRIAAGATALSSGR
jgi:TolB-like protein/DNA-binding winged helix-turn-helix (wHTH) protein/Tfp pilus assembly protein PilF